MVFRLLKRFLVFDALIVLIIVGAVFFFGLNIDGITGPFKQFFEKREPTCIYEAFTSDTVGEVPLDIEADVEFIDNKTVLLRNPKGCEKQFEFVARIGSKGDVVSDVLQMNDADIAEKKTLMNLGFDDYSTYFIGDVAAFNSAFKERSQSRIGLSILEKGDLNRIKDTKLRYSVKQARVFFNRSFRVYYYNNQMYIHHIYFNKL